MRTKKYYRMEPIGFIRSDYKTPSDVPRGLGAEHKAEGVLEIRPEFRKGLKDLDGFSHLFVLWVFHQSPGYDLTAYPPADNKPHGVFATRSPQRPSPIGLTVVELQHVEGRKLYLRGVDMIDGTPVLDIKPYLSSIPMKRLKRGWLAEAEKAKKI